MARKLKSDKLLFTATLLLVCISVVMVYSASAVMAMEQNHAPYYYLFKQAAWALLGLLFVPIVMHIDYRNYRQPAVIWAMLGVVSVALVAVLFGRPVNGASRWLLLGSLVLTRGRFRLLSSAVSLAVLAGSFAMRVRVLGEGDRSARRPDVTMRFAQPD